MHVVRGTGNYSRFRAVRDVSWESENRGGPRTNAFTGQQLPREHNGSRFSSRTSVKTRNQFFSLRRPFGVRTYVNTSDSAEFLIFAVSIKKRNIIPTKKNRFYSTRLNVYRYIYTTLAWVMMTKEVAERQWQALGETIPSRRGRRRRR